MDAKKFFIVFGACLAMLIGMDVFVGHANDPIVDRVSPQSDVIGMPLVQDSDPITSGLRWGAPQEDRTPQYYKYLSASVKISVSGASGSGTIVYYDSDKQEAYVASCGHLWNGTKTAQELKSNPPTCKIITWYHNLDKLPSPQEYPATVLFWSNVRGYDSSLVKFKTDWIPEYYPIAPLEYPMTIGTHFHSCGCDGGREVARYDVEIVGYRGDDLITTRNSPRPGRSGGGLLSEDGFYVGTCWGTSDTTGGGGIGYFTPLKSIHQVYQNNGYSWLLEVNNAMARKIPIFDMNNPQGKYPQNYVPLPNNNKIPIPH